MFLSLLIALQMGSADVTGQWSSYILDQRWDFTVLRRDLERTPLWSDSDETPPLPPRRAIAAARSELERLVPAADAWRLSNVQLRPVDGPGRWIYLVGFDEPAPGPVGGIGQTLEMVVLMNGVAIQPTRTPWPVAKWAAARRFVAQASYRLSLHAPINRAARTVQSFHDLACPSSHRVVVSS